jgi:predicted rRNA methylase YqxC with S4 and FtsJ domains
VVRDPGLRLEAAVRVADALEAAGAAVVGAAGRGLPGPKGNREVVVYADASRERLPRDARDERLRAAVAAGERP